MINMKTSLRTFLASSTRTTALKASKPDCGVLFIFPPATDKLWIGGSGVEVEAFEDTDIRDLLELQYSDQLVHTRSDIPMPEVLPDDATTNTQPDQATRPV
jgi:hypothetical protein